MLGDFAEELTTEWALETELPLLSRCGSLGSQLKHTKGVNAEAGCLLFCFTFSEARILQYSGFLMHRFLLAQYFNFPLDLFSFFFGLDSSKIYFQNRSTNYTCLWTWMTCSICTVIRITVWTACKGGKIEGILFSPILNSSGWLGICEDVSRRQHEISVWIDGGWFGINKWMWQLVVQGW